MMIRNMSGETSNGVGGEHVYPFTSTGNTPIKFFLYEMMTLSLIGPGKKIARKTLNQSNQIYQ
jgi:hypothetical protein